MKNYTRIWIIISPTGLSDVVSEEAQQAEPKLVCTNQAL